MNTDMTSQSIRHDLIYMFNECGFDERQEHIDKILSRMTLAMNDYIKDDIYDSTSGRCDEQMLGGK